MHDDAFRQLLNHFHLSWNGYRKVRKGVKKRIHRHMLALGCRTMAAYLEALEHDGAAKKECERHMSVSISRFFRDRHLWECLQYEVFPKFMEKYVGELRIWSAGCARGEEAYSVKILWDRMRGSKKVRPSLRLLASDLNEVYLAKARSGIFNATSLKEVSEEEKKKFFVAKAGQWVISEEMRKGIGWEQRDVLQDLPDTIFDLVFIRNNLLTYYEGTIRDPAFHSLVQKVRPGGFLVIGAHEKIPEGANDLLPYPSHPCLFQRAEP